MEACCADKYSVTSTPAVCIRKGRKGGAEESGNAIGWDAAGREQVALSPSELVDQPDGDENDVKVGER